MFVEIYLTSGVHTVDLFAVYATLQVANIKVHLVEVDIKKAMEKSRGCIHPGYGFVLLIDGYPITNVFQLVRYLDENGLIPC